MIADLKNKPMIHFMDDAFSNKIRAAVFLYDPTGRRVSACTMMEFGPTNQDEGSPDNLTELVIRREGAQRMIDDLWRLGLRPSRHEDTAGVLRATREHLADMRDLVATHRELKRWPR